MEKNKMNKLDLIFIVGIGVIAILGVLIDGLCILFYHFYILRL